MDSDVLRLHCIVERNVMRIGSVLELPLAQAVFAVAQFFSSWIMLPSPFFHDW